MGLRLKLASDSYNVEPGVAVSVAIEIANAGSAAQRVEISVEGIDPEWVAIPVPVLEIGGGETALERVFLKPPREPESLSGTYPFVVKAKTEQGEEETVVCSLEVKPYHNVSIDVQPRRGLVSTMSREAVFQVTVMNLGNVEHTVKLLATDAAELFAFEFDQEQVSVAPGAQKTISMTVTATKSPLLANARLQQLTVSARSLDDRTVATATHAQVEQRALITPGTIWALAFLLLFVASAILLWPKQPVVDAISVSPERVLYGESFTIEWSTSNARAVELTVDGETFRDLRANGSKTIDTNTLEDVGAAGRQIEIRLRAFSGRKSSPPKTRTIPIGPKRIVPEPEILEFSINPIELEVGEVYQVRYRLSDSVTEAVLDPIGQILDLRLESDQFTALIPGEFDYKLIARNEAGQEVEKTIRVTITEGSDASIVVFRADPALVDPLDGRVTLTWQVQNWSRIELYENGKFVSPHIDQSQGEIVRLISFDTTFKLIAYDEQGRTVEKEVTVKTHIPPDDFP